MHSKGKKDGICEILSDKNKKSLVKINDNVWGNLKLSTKCSFYIKLKI